MGKPIDPKTPGDWHDVVTDGTQRWRGLLDVDLASIGILNVEAGRTAKTLSRSALAAEAKRNAKLAAGDPRVASARRSVHDTPRDGVMPATVRVLYSAAPFSASAQRRVLEAYGVWPAGEPIG